MRLVRALDRHRRVTSVPSQKPGVPEAHGLTRAQVEAAAWAVLPDGRRVQGAAAINWTLAVALGNRLPVFVYGLPVIHQIQDRVYAWVADHRSRFPGDTPYCRQHPDECGAG